MEFLIKQNKAKREILDDSGDVEEVALIPKWMGSIG